MCNSLYRDLNDKRESINNIQVIKAKLYLIFGDSRLFLAVPLAVMKAGAVAVEYV